MAAVNVVLADAQATPVNHTFVPRGPDREGVFWWEDQSPASPIGYWRISMLLKRPTLGAAGTTSNQRTYRAVIGLHEPTLENVTNNTVSGIAPAPTVSYVPRVFVEFVLPERSSLQNRKDLRKMVYNLLNETQLVALAETLITPY
jgi:hypothetical protein